MGLVFAVSRINHTGSALHASHQEQELGPIEICEVVKLISSYSSDPHTTNAFNTIRRFGWDKTKYNVSEDTDDTDVCFQE